MNDIIEWLKTLDWKFIVADIIVPIATFIVGLFTGKGIEKRKSKSSVKGNNNTVIQNSKINE